MLLYGWSVFERCLNAPVSRHFSSLSEQLTYKCNHVELFGAFTVWKSEEKKNGSDMTVQRWREFHSANRRPVEHI